MVAGDFTSCSTTPGQVTLNSLIDSQHFSDGSSRYCSSCHKISLCLHWSPVHQALHVLPEKEIRWSQAWRARGQVIGPPRPISDGSSCYCYSCHKIRLCLHWSPVHQALYVLPEKEIQWSQVRGARGPVCFYRFIRSLRSRISLVFPPYPEDGGDTFLRNVGSNQ
jgi:hypothetical protein